VSGPIRLLVCDDSETARCAITRALPADIEVVGEATTGDEAVRLAGAAHPHVITMDVQMPGRSGIEATAAIMAQSPSRILVVCAVDQEREIDLSFRAIAAGALELVAKPKGGGDLAAWGQRLAETVRLMSEVPVVTRKAHQRVHNSVSPVGRIDIWGVVASTGGPPALSHLLANLPADLPAPVLMVQHIAPGFAVGLCRYLSCSSRLAVVCAEDGRPALPGYAYLPPDGHDLLIDAEGVLRTPRNCGPHHPNGDRLLTALADVYGPRAGGVVLTGMGEDGARGLLAIRHAGGCALAQDAASSIVFGMPQAALRHGAVVANTPLVDIAPSMLAASGLLSSARR